MVEFDQTPEQLPMVEDAEEYSIKPRKVFSRVGLALVVWLLAPILPQAIIMGAVMAVENLGLIPQGSISANPWYVWLVTFAPNYVIGFPLCYAVLDSLPRGGVPKNRMGFKNFLAILAMCVPVMYAGNLLGNLLSGLFSGGQSTNALEALAMDAIPLWMKVLVFVVLAPLVEETVFRKLLLDRTARYGEKIAVIFSALAFALFHMNLYQFFYAFGLGLLLAYAYIRTGRLACPLALHALFNFLGSIVPLWLTEQVDLEALGESGLADAPMPGTLWFGLYVLFIIAFSVLGVVLLVKRWKKARFFSTAAELSGKDRFCVPYLNFGVILFVLLSAAMTVVTLLVV